MIGDWFYTAPYSNFDDAGKATQSCHQQEALHDE